MAVVNTSGAVVAVVNTSGFWVKTIGLAETDWMEIVSRSGNLKGLARGPVRNTLSGRLLKQDNIIMHI